MPDYTVRAKAISGLDTGKRLKVEKLDEPQLLSQQGAFPRGTAFAASLVVPGLGQHLQGRSNRGWLYMGLAGVPGILALWANSRYNGTLDDYKELRTQLAGKTGDDLTPDIEDLIARQNQAHDDAESERTFVIATQVIFGLIWAANVVDAGMTEFRQPARQFSWDAHPTTDGGRILVHVSF